MGNYSDQFGRDMLENMNFPVTDENLKALAAWAKAEGGKAKFNPFNTTQDWPGATDYNSVHVRNYADYSDGLHATIKTLSLGYYPNIRQALGRGDSAMAVAEAIRDSPWGTGDGVINVLNSGSVTPTPPKPVNGFKNGDSGSAISAIQYALNTLGYGLTPDGAFGPLTEAAVKNFQDRHGLSTDGVVGPLTTAALVAVLPQVKSGDSGGYVAIWQAILNAYGAHLDTDGSFGPLTEAATKSFQSSKKVSSDGIVGPITWGKSLTG